MFLKRAILGLSLMLAAAGAVGAQGLTPMRKEGLAATDAKGFFVTVRNPYDRPMSFDLTPLETDLATPAAAAEARPGKLRLGAGRSRRVVLLFQIPQNAKERSVALCVSPSEPTGAVLARVCGTYTGRRAR